MYDMTSCFYQYAGGGGSAAQLELLTANRSAACLVGKNTVVQFICAVVLPTSKLGICPVAYQTHKDMVAVLFFIQPWSLFQWNYINYGRKSR